MPLAGLLVLVAGLCLTPMAETDLFFRLRMGQEILATWAVPRRNLFSFTYPDHPDLDPAWLFDVAVAALYRAGGFPAIVVAKTILVLAIFAGAYLLCRRRGAGPIASALALAAAALVMRERLVERPHLFSFAGEVGVLVVLAVAETRPRALWVVVPLAALWANLHAGAFLAPTLVAAWTIGALLDRDPGAPGRMAVAAAAAVALAVTPVGPGIFRYLGFHVGIFALHPVDEFRPVSWTSDAPLILYAAVVALLVATTRARRWRDVLPVLFVGVLAARTIRFGADFALLAAPLAARALAARMEVLSWRARLDGGTARALTGALLVAAAVAPRLATGDPLVSVGLDRAALPIEAVRFAEEHGLRERMYNDFEDGAYLAFQGFPRYRVFIDPRLPAYPAAFHRLLGRSEVPRTEWDDALERLGVESALLTSAGINHRIGWWDPARWALVYRAHDARLFVRRLPGFRDVIRDFEIPATFTFTVSDGTVTVPLEQPPPGSDVSAAEWQRRLADLRLDLAAASRAGR
jgi:hypothetical protein